MALDGGIPAGVPSWEAPSPAFSRSGYPVEIIYERPPRHHRFWAIPILGGLAKSIILIPHVIVLSLLAVIVAISQWILWIPVLFGGHYPLWGYAIVGGTLRWSTRVSAFSFGLTDQYPPFTFRSSSEEGSVYAVQVRFEIPGEHSRGWAIPFFGLVAKTIITIPHTIILYFLLMFVGLAGLILWVPVLFNARYPDWGYEFVGGTLRWNTRLAAYLYGLTDRYPPFSFD
jgi:hypothetical protein